MNWNKFPDTKPPKSWWGIEDSEVHHLLCAYTERMPNGAIVWQFGVFYYLGDDSEGGWQDPITSDTWAESLVEYWLPITEPK